MAFLFSALLATAVANGAVPPARSNQCGWVHGRFAIYNGSSVRRIWVIGTSRIIALTDDDNDIPPAIERYQREATERRGKEDGLFGDFYVCARERRRSGWMQHVRLRRTKKLVYRNRPF